jgi:hypothetical protein
MKNGRNWTLEERHMIFDLIRAGATLRAVNESVADYQKQNNLGPRQMPESSYRDVKNRYIPSATSEDDYLDMIRNPRTWSSLTQG